MSSLTGSLVLDAEALYRELLRGVRSLMSPETRLVGITSGGAWLVERLQVFRPLILALDQAVRQVSQPIEAAAPAVRPKGMGRLTHETVQTEVADWNRFQNRRQVGSG